jgi:D-alanyl-D-alanine endopeptidase (penicillin-binding protein 7)
MFKSAFGVALSLLFVIGTVPAVDAVAATGEEQAVEQPVAKSAGRAKHKRRHHASVASLDAHEKLVRKVVYLDGKRKVIYQRVALGPVIPAVPPVMTAGDVAGLNLTRDPLALKSSVALVMEQSSSKVLFEKNSSVALPIASITKLMTSVVVVEANQNMDEVLTITAEDVDHEKNSGSRLRVGSQLTRANMLHIALMSSENRAASALGRNYPGGLPAFVTAMNAKAKALGMLDTHYVDSNGLSSQNVASARDLAKLVMAAQKYPIICQYSTDPKYVVETGAGGHALQYANTNHLVTSPGWEIGLQKTGYINEAGRCLVMQAMIEGRAIVMIFLDSKGKQSRLADAGRIRKWLVGTNPQAVVQDLAAVPQS